MTNDEIIELLDLHDYSLSKNEIMIHCPFCDHHKKKLSINSEKEVFKCWICDETGPLGKLENKLKGSYNISRENKMIVNAPKHVSLINPGHNLAISYLKSRRIDSFDLIGYDISANAIIFPYYNPETTELNAIKYKYLNNTNISYKLEGQHPGMYVPDIEQYKNVLSLEDNKTLILVEGELDSISTLQYLVKTKQNDKVTVAATTGITNKGCVKYLENFNSVYIGFDNEKKPNLIDKVTKALKSLILDIRTEYPEMEIKIIKLPSTCKDMNDFICLNYSEEDFLKLIQDAELYTEDRSYINAVDLFEDMEDYLKNKTKSKGMPTFLEGIDEILGGGKRLGEITALHAEAKTGKNCVWHKMMHMWLEAGIPIGYASRELTPETEVMPNIFSIHFQKNWWDEYHKDRITDAHRKLAIEKAKEWKLYFAKGYGIFDFEALVKWVQEMKNKLGVQYFFFDHLHYLLYNSEDVKEISVFCRNLKQLVKEENIHIDIIIQPRKLMETQRLNLNSLRGGAAIGQAIDNLFVLERVPEYKDISKLTLEVARHKLARSGKSVYLKYDPITTDIWEVQPVEAKEVEKKDDMEPKKSYLQNKIIEV